MTRARRARALSSLVRGTNTKEIERAGEVHRDLHAPRRGRAGLGPLSVREAPVVAEGFRSRQYRVNECTEICSITVNGSKSRRERAKRRRMCERWHE